MLRRCHLVLATVSTGKQGSAGPAKRKSKWIDRRRKTPLYGGREVYPSGQFPSCELCQMKFQFKQDFLSHNESDIHKNRLKWKETTSWWTTEGRPSLLRHQTDQWEWFVKNVASLEASAAGVSVPHLVREKQYKTARVDDVPSMHVALQPPTAKLEIPEPRDNRWPFSPKW